MSIFIYDDLKEKALREIDRLVNALNNRYFLDALDHALNAAFSIYHLLEWKNKQLNSEYRSAQTLASESDNENLKILHYIVCHIKHAECRKSFDYEGTIPKTVHPPFLCTEDSDYLTTEDEAIISEEGEFNIYFGEYERYLYFKTHSNFSIDLFLIKKLKILKESP